MSRFVRALLPVISPVFLVAPLLAQTASFRLAGKQRAYLPELPDYTSAIAAGDVDGDGSTDLVFGTTGPAGGAQDRLLLNDGEGVYRDASATNMPRDAEVTVAGTLVDIDGDRDLDLILASANRRRVYVNDGRGRFSDETAARLPQHTGSTTSIAAADVDGDGDADLVFGEGADRSNGFANRLYLNDGTGKFGEAPSGRLPAVLENTKRVLLVDVDGDRDLDLFAANTGRTFFNVEGQDRLFANDGRGRFTEVTGTSLPVDSDKALAAVSADLEGDGDADLLILNSLGAGFRVRINDGKGKFTNAAWTPSGIGGFDLVAGDLTGNNKPDVYVVGGPATVLLANDGTGRLAAAVPQPPGNIDDTRAVAVADCDADGRLDVVIGVWRSRFQNWSRNRLLLNSGRGFVLVPRYELGAETVMAEAMVAADFDGDDDIDVLLGDWNLKNELFLNDGNGGFSHVDGRLPTTRNSTRALAAGDVDGDGDVDVYVANGNNVRTQDELWLNDGRGRFRDATSTHLPTSNDRAFAVAMGDIDGDRDLDVVVGNGQHSGAINKVYLNDGKGKFSELAGAMPNIATRTRSLVLVDLDGDRDLDVVWADWEDNRILINDGTGRFTDETARRYPQALRRGSGSHVTAGDVDGDGDADLFFAAHSLRANRLFRNDGKGFFTDVTTGQLPAVDRPAVAAGFADFDEDGDLDLFLGHEGGAVFLNQGNGTFVDGPDRVEVDGNPTHSLALVDVDQDGDVDAVLGRYMRIGFALDVGRHRVLFNRRRDWSADRFVYPGRSYTLRLTVEGAGGRVALPFLNFAGLQPRQQFFEFGRFGLQLPGLIPLPALVTSATGTAELPLQMPNLSNLSGVSIFTQPLVLHGASAATWRYAGVVQDTFR